MQVYPFLRSKVTRRRLTVGLLFLKILNLLLY